MKKIPKADIADLTHKIDNLLSVLQQPDKNYQELLNYSPRAQQAGCSKDLFFLTVTMRSIIDSYLRAKGLKSHPASKTGEEFQSAWLVIATEVGKEVNRRAFLYPSLHKTLTQEIVDQELEQLLFQKGATEEGEHGQ